MNIIIKEQNPMINFRKKKKKEDRINKNPNFEKFRKSHKNAWVYAWKHENKCKREDIRVLLALGPCKKFGQKQQKILSGALPSQREREESLKKFEKVRLK